MRRALLFIPWLLAAVPAAATAQEGITDAAIDRWIVTHAERSKGAEHRNSRRAVVGDLDGDGRSDVAVLYTIEGAQGHDFALRYLAVFRRGASGLDYETHLLVGGKGIREVNRAAILAGTVVLETLEYQPKDAVCCPSKSARWRYRLREGRLVEVKAAPAKAKGADAKAAKQ
jgi:hypothetical protein